jgi:demethylmenaquinone methyltransferase/2-methoxy-6-polyprenyl-1,4-benzoquinol methylase
MTDLAIKQDPPIEALLSEQRAYYRAVAPDYVGAGIPGVDQRTLAAAARELREAVEALGFLGEVLELACGPGTWTEMLAGQAQSVTAVDAAPEMLALAEARIADARVRFIEADVFHWAPDRRYDTVFFGFWLSHVPLERLDTFWASVAEWLEPRGRAVFVDDSHRTSEELVEGPRSPIVRRRLADGTAFRAFKVAHSPPGLERRLRRLGWDASVTGVRGLFYWGMAGRA